MLLAAGRGERMRPLTDRTPKPLLQVGGQPLLFWHLERLSRAGFRRVVINHAHLGEQIESAVGDGSRWSIEARFSAEPTALETAGGIANALPLIGETTFAVINADVYTDYDYTALRLRADQMRAAPSPLAHLVLVDNPVHHPQGDFALFDGLVHEAGPAQLTFSGIGVYRRELFAGIASGSRQPLAPLLRQAMAQRRVSGEHFGGRWIDVGTPERLLTLDRLLAGDRT